MKQFLSIITWPIKKTLLFCIITIRPLLGPANCRFPVTCGKFAIDQLKNKPLGHALFNIIKRLLDCANPFWRKSKPFLGLLFFCFFFTSRSTFGMKDNQKKTIVVYGNIHEVAHPPENSRMFFWNSSLTALSLEDFNMIIAKEPNTALILIEKEKLRDLKQWPRLKYLGKGTIPSQLALTRKIKKGLQEQMLQNGQYPRENEPTVQEQINLIREREKALKQMKRKEELSSSEIEAKIEAGVKEKLREETEELRKREEMLEKGKVFEIKMLEQKILELHKNILELREQQTNQSNEQYKETTALKSDLHEAKVKIKSLEKENKDLTFEKTVLSLTLLSIKDHPK